MSGSRKPVSNPSIGLQIQARPEPARLMDGPRANPTWVAGGTWSRGRGGRCIGGLPGIWIWIPSLPLPGGWSCAGGLSTRRPDVPLCVCRCGGHGWLTGRSGVDGRWVCWAGLGSMLGCKFFFCVRLPHLPSSWILLGGPGGAWLVGRAVDIYHYLDFYTYM